MLRDWCTWDDDYNLGILTPVRRQLAALASPSAPEAYTCTLMQGSGTFSVEAMLGSAVPADGKLLVLANGTYGNRLAQIADYLHIDHLVHDSGELAPPDLELLDDALRTDPAISHVVCVHNETTTGMLNPLSEIARIVKGHHRVFLLDSMSAFGGIPLDMAELGIDFLVSSANKCIQGVPGFGFVLATHEGIAQCEGNARSLSLDLFAQWRTMEDGHGKWRFTSPTHVVRAFHQALRELDEEGGIDCRHRRYARNWEILVDGMRRLGFRCLLPDRWQSPFITAFHNPEHPDFSFTEFYDRLKQRGFVIYPGKVTGIDSFRIGTIGHVFPDDFVRLIKAVENSIFWE
jgi:2-aminoethylphosphonate-pyruvate transaminase